MKFLKRAKTIIKANANEILERLEEPKKILKQAVRDMEDQKLRVGKKIIELNSKLKEIKRKSGTATGEMKTMLDGNITRIETALKKMVEQYDGFDGKINECKSKLTILEARCVMVETMREANELLKEIDFDLDTSTFARMEEKVTRMEEKLEAEQEFYGR